MEKITLKEVNAINEILYQQVEALQKYEGDDITTSCNAILSAIQRNIKYFTDQNLKKDGNKTSNS